MIDKNLALLERFQELEKSHPGPIPYSIQLGPKNSDQKLFICAAAHGNEVGSIPAMIRYAEDAIENPPNLSLVLALGNIGAIKIDQRYVEEDMNRAYGRSEVNTSDAYRARELGEVIEWADLFVDLHQTIEATEGSFYVLRNDKTSQDLSQALALAKHAIIIDDEKAEKKDHMTGTTFALKNNTAAFTLELSEKGYSDEAESLAYQSINKVVDFLSQNGLSNLKSEAAKQPSLISLDVAHAEKFVNREMHLVGGLRNLAFYKQGTLLAKDGERDIVAPFDGYIFFPKYPPRDASGKVEGIVPTNIFMFAKKI